MPGIADVHQTKTKSIGSCQVTSLWVQNIFHLDYSVQSLRKTMENKKQDSGEFDTEGVIFQDKGSCNTDSHQSDNDFDTGLVMRDAYGREVRQSSKYKNFANF